MRWEQVTGVGLSKYIWTGARTCGIIINLNIELLLLPCGERAYMVKMLSMNDY